MEIAHHPRSYERECQMLLIGIGYGGRRCNFGIARHSDEAQILLITRHSI
jgi:hypothetical protein